MTRQNGRWSDHDEPWIDGLTGQRVYRPADNAPVTSWIVIHGAAEAPERPQDAPGRPLPAPVDVGTYSRPRAPPADSCGADPQRRQRRPSRR